jgi:hypothetical protein
MPFPGQSLLEIGQTDLRRLFLRADRPYEQTIPDPATLDRLDASNPE